MGSLQSGMPRLSDSSHASDGKIHVDRLRLAPVLTNDVDEELKTPDIGLPYPLRSNKATHKHDRGSSLGTIHTVHSNAAAHLSTMDVREYQQNDSYSQNNTAHIR